jgi:hypothetical protein
MNKFVDCAPEGTDGGRKSVVGDRQLGASDAPEAPPVPPSAQIQPASHRLCWESRVSRANKERAMLALKLRLKAGHRLSPSCRCSADTWTQPHKDLRSKALVVVDSLTLKAQLPALARPTGSGAS